MTSTAFGWMVAALAEGVWIALLVAMIALRERDHRKLLDAITDDHAETLKRIGNMQSFGTPTPPPVTVSREIDAEERVQRMVSEATIQNGMNELRHLYTGQGLRVPEDDVLRSEAISMLGQIEPVIDTATLTRSS